MRIVYLGTPEFAVKPFAAVVGYERAEVVAAVCNPDRPVGRKQILTAPPVKVFAESEGIPVFQYGKIRKEGVADMLALKPDLMITCAFGQILSQEILDIPRLGVINIHASLLPAYRGASPINYAIKNGEKETGITVMKTDIGIDTGDVLLYKKIKIGDTETAGELSERLSETGAVAIKEALDLIADGNAKFVKQDESRATLTKIIKKEDAHIDFGDLSENVVNFVRAFNPAPVAFAYLRGEPFKIYKAEKAEGAVGAAGVVLKTDGELLVGTKDGAVRLLSVQKAGGKRMDAADFLRGGNIAVGDGLE